jgi:hypothetical protein
MKIKVGVRCPYWDRPEYVDIELPDDASEEEIEDAVREAALEQSKLEYWAE